MLSATLLVFLCFQLSDGLPVNLAEQGSCCCHGCDGTEEEDTCREGVRAERLIGMGKIDDSFPRTKLLPKSRQLSKYCEIDAEDWLMHEHVCVH